MKILDIIAWVLDLIGSSSKRHKGRALKFIREAAARAALRKKK